MRHLLLTLLLLRVCFSVIGVNNAQFITLDARVTPDSTALLLRKKSEKASDSKIDRTPNVTFGIKVGTGLSNSNFNKGFPKPAVQMETAWRSGYAAGFIVEVPLSKKLYLQQEYSFAHLRGEVIEEVIAYKFDYLSLPVLLKYKIINRVFLVTGPQFDILLQAREQKKGACTYIRCEAEARNIGAVAGVEFQLANKLGLDARFVQGLNHIGTRQGTGMKEFKMEMLQVSVMLTPFR